MGWRVSSQSASARATDRDALPTGSSSKIPRRQRSGARPRRIGRDEGCNVRRQRF
jgi:hypothetical protein